MSARLCIEAGIEDMRVRVKRLRDEAARAECEREARTLREMAGIVEQAMWDVEDQAAYWEREFGGDL